jgi:tetratricopeptide (TPR) repeat protein
MDMTGDFRDRTPGIPAAVRNLQRDPRNAGPVTVSRYDYQAKCIALTIVDHMLSGELLAVVVEHSTDLILVPIDGPPVLVSVKHRDQGQVDGDGWTMSALKKQRVLQSLYDAWDASGRSCQVSFWTNAGLSGDAAVLGQLCSSVVDMRDEHSTERVWPMLAKHLGVGRGAAREFLAALRLQNLDQILPRRHDIDDVAVRRMQTMLAQLGREMTHAEACWEWLLRVHVEPASRDPAQSPEFRAVTLGGALGAVARRREEELLAFRYLPIEEVRVGLLREADRREAQRTPDVRPWAADPMFVGRSPELERLAELLAPGGVDPVTPVVIHGLAGCGKTSLALRFAADHAMRLRTVVIDAGTRPGVVAGLDALHPSSQTYHDAHGVADLRAATTLTLPGGSATLVILDGVTDAEAIRGLVPRLGLCRVLITSTVAHLDDGFNMVHLGVWPREDSHAYIARTLPEATPADGEMLATELADHPLATCQAVNYCKKLSLSVGEYLNRLREAPSSVLDRGDAVGHPASIVQAIRLAAAAAEDRSAHAGAMLRMLAHLGSGPVALDLFDGAGSEAVATVGAARSRRGLRRKTTVHWYPAHEETKALCRDLSSSVERDAAVVELAAFSLVTPIGGHVVVHPLVQMVVREDTTDPLTWFQLTLGLFVSSLADGKSLWWTLDPHLGHLAASIEFARRQAWNGPIVAIATSCVIARSSELGDPSAHLEVGYRMLDELSQSATLTPWAVESSFELRSAMRRALFFLGRGLEAVALAEENLRIAEAEGSDGVRWRALIELGEIGYELGRRDVALQILDQLPDPRYISTEQSLTTPIGIANVRAKLLAIANRLDEAGATIDWALDRAAQLPTEPFKSTVSAVIHATAAEIHHVPGAAHAVSLEHAMSSLDAQRERVARHGADRGYVTTLLTAADCAIDTQDYERAAAWLGEAENLAIGELGPGTTTYALLLAIRGRHRLGVAINGWVGQEEWDVKPAIADLERAARELRSQAFTLQIPSVLIHLAQALKMDGRVNEAFERANEALELDLKIFGPNHPEVQTDRLIIDQLGYSIFRF